MAAIAVALLPIHARKSPPSPRPSAWMVLVMLAMVAIPPVHRWIRTPGHFDAVIDFDTVLPDPPPPDRLLAAFASGHQLHPSPSGYAAMADDIPLSLLPHRLRLRPPRLPSPSTTSQPTAYCRPARRGWKLPRRS